MEKVYNYLLNELPIKYGDSVVVAVSGGPDSMVLLDLLLRIKKNIDIEIICAHVNHNIRKESNKEAVFVENYCVQNNVIFESTVLKEYGDDNFHNEARNKRYSFFTEIVKKYNSKYLFTAHHGDDLIETILMRIVRGSSLRGYSGFSKVINMENYKIIRPLITVTKEQILSYLKNNKIKYVSDSSNKKDVYTRNRFRRYIVPQFKKEDTNVHNKFYKFSRTLLECNEYIDKIVKEKINGIYSSGIINIENFKKEEKLIQNKVIYNIFEKIYQDDLILINDLHVELIMDLINSVKPNLTIYLPNNIKAIKEYNNITFIKEENTEDDYEIELINYVSLSNNREIKIIKESDKTSNNVCRLSSKEIKLPLHVRNRRDGDKIYLKGMIGSKKIKDIFIDSKIPLKERNKWPIVVDSNGEIIWIPGIKKSKYDKKKDDFYDIIIEYY
ncbi:MAG TPA: tRNA lysidine(34) synthetase TilS [Tenericutes bacterium]|nr:tRNA lysidine(34) synthetase TilS [Mycoplasmatota bacterium]